MCYWFWETKIVDEQTPSSAQGTRMSNIGPQDIEGAASAVLGIWTQMLWENVGNDGNSYGFMPYRHYRAILDGGNF